MTEKLTAKLSDGREFEILCEHKTLGEPNHILYAKRIEPEPREWWVLWDVSRDEPRSSLLTEGAARIAHNALSPLTKLVKIKVREVVE